MEGLLKMILEQEIFKLKCSGTTEGILSADWFREDFSAILRTNPYLDSVVREHILIIQTKMFVSTCHLLLFIFTNKCAGILFTLALQW